MSQKSIHDLTPKCCVHLPLPFSMKIFLSLKVVNRPCVAGAVLQTALLLID